MDASFDELMIKNRMVRNIILIIAGLAICMGISLAYALYKAVGNISPFLISHSRWYVFYSFIVAILACAVGVIGYLAICRDKYLLSQGMTYVIIMIILGIIYTMVMVPLSVPDEPTHYNNALVVSNKIITFCGGDGTPSQREMSLKSFGDGSYIYEFWNGIKEDDNPLGLTGIWKSEQMPLYPYFFSGVMIALLKCVGAPYQIFVVMGRLINLLLFSLITLLCIRICPRFKTIILTFSFLPAVVWMENSFSYDSLNFSMANLFICYCIRCRDKYKVSIKDIIMLIAIMLSFAPIKYIYVVMAIFVFIIPLSHFQIKNKKRIAMIGGAALLAMMAILAKLRGSEILYLLGSGADGRFAGTSDTTYTLTYAIRHPFTIIMVFFKTIIEKSEFYFIRGLCGENYTNYVPHTLLIILAVIVIRILVGGTDYENVNKRDRAVSWMTFLVMSGVVFVSFLFLYSVIPSEEGLIGIVDGVQGRYFLPLFLILPLMLFIKKYKLSEYQKKNYLFGLLMINIVITLFKYSGALLG